MYIERLPKVGRLHVLTSLSRFQSCCPLFTNALSLLHSTKRQGDTAKEIASGNMGLVAPVLICPSSPPSTTVVSPRLEAKFHQQPHSMSDSDGLKQTQKSQADEEAQEKPKAGRGRTWFRRRETALASSSSAASATPANLKVATISAYHMRWEHLKEFLIKTFNPNGDQMALWGLEHDQSSIGGYYLFNLPRELTRVNLTVTSRL